MISYLKGIVIDKSIESATLDVHSVGYELSCSLPTLDALSIGDETSLWVHTHMREDALTLYGFQLKLERQIFLSLTKVNGVGPKMAMKVLSGTTLPNLVNMIDQSDVKALSQLPKVGKKTAEQIVLTLKGKLVIDQSEGASLPKVGAKHEIVSALVHLGFKIQDVEKAIETLPKDISVEDGVRRGLSLMTQI